MQRNIWRQKEKVRIRKTVILVDTGEPRSLYVLIKYIERPISLAHLSEM